MTNKEIIYIASKVASKGWDYETMKYSDDLYGKEEFADEVWDYVIEYQEYGSINFYKKYAEYKLY